MNKKEGYFPQFLRDISIEGKLEPRIGESSDFYWGAHHLLEDFGRKTSTDSNFKYSWATEKVGIENKNRECFFINLAILADEDSSIISPFANMIIIDIVDEKLRPLAKVELQPNSDCLIEISDMAKRRLTNREKIHLRGFFTCLEEKLREKAEEKRNEEPKKITPEDIEVDVFWPDGLSPF